MNKFLLLCTLLLTIKAFGQLKITEISKAEDLMNVLLGDQEDIEISNISIKGNKKSFGIFNCDLERNDLFNNGIIMTTGLASNAIGPNDDPHKSTEVNYISDPDINKIAEHKGCYDTALFEFDLISNTDEIEFRFFFASEEYPEYINKNVNDVFIFLVTNLTTNASENIAILNGDKNIPITVDHINPKVNSDYYIESFNWNKSNFAKYKNDKKKLELPFVFQYDGFTKVLNATAKVVPNTKYHLKLGISDVGDQLYDSAIFLEENSLKSTGKRNDLANYLNKPEDTISIDFDIKFEVASSKIKGDHSFKLMDEITTQLKNNPKITIEIIGHTDSTGNDQSNQILSVNRAQTVADYFINSLVNTSRITIKGMGEKQPKSNIKSENRRVEIVFKKL